MGKSTILFDKINGLWVPHISVTPFKFGLQQFAEYICGADGTCDAAELQDLINSAEEGDTIKIAAGTHNWGTDDSVTINKSIIIDGQGASTGCGTSSPGGTWPATFDIDVDNTPAFSIVSSDPSDVIRITGIHLTGDVPGGTAAIGGIRIGSNNLCPNVRVDNCKFETSGNSYANEASGLGGLVDHNWFQANGCNSNAAIILRDFRGGNYGGWPWAQTLNWGSDDFLFIEDNSFTSTCTAEGANLYLWVQGGGQWVLRYNYIQGRFAKVYGCYTSNYRSGVACEIYENTIYMPNNTNEKCFQIEGGAALIHNNTTEHYSTICNLIEQRAGGAKGDFGVAGQNWDGNLGEPYPTGYPLLDQIGRGKAASTAYTVSPYCQPQEARATRIWNNTHDCTPWHGIVGTATADYIVEDRDYYTCENEACDWVTTFLAGYTPYTYPHPLQGNGNGGANKIVFVLK